MNQARHWSEQITPEARAELEARARCSNAATYRAFLRRDLRLRVKRLRKQPAIAEARARLAGAVQGGAHGMD